MSLLFITLTNLVKIIKVALHRRKRPFLLHYHRPSIYFSKTTADYPIDPTSLNDTKSSPEKKNGKNLFLLRYLDINYRDNVIPN